MEGMREAGWLELGLGWGGVRSHPSNNPTYKLDCPWNVESERWCSGSVEARGR